jgi:hypothetical protein
MICLPSSHSTDHQTSLETYTTSCGGIQFPVGHEELNFVVPLVAIEIPNLMLLLHAAETEFKATNFKILLANNEYGFYRKSSQSTFGIPYEAFQRTIVRYAETIPNVELYTYNPTSEGFVEQHTTKGDASALLNSHEFKEYDNPLSVFNMQREFLAEEGFLDLELFVQFETEYDIDSEPKIHLRHKETGSLLRTSACDLKPGHTVAVHLTGFYNSIVLNDLVLLALSEMLQDRYPGITDVVLFSHITPFELGSSVDNPRAGVTFHIFTTNVTSEFFNFPKWLSLNKTLVGDNLYVYPLSNHLLAAMAGEIPKELGIYTSTSKITSAS